MATTEHADLVRALTRAALQDDAVHRAQESSLRRYYQQRHAIAADPLDNDRRRAARLSRVGLPKRLATDVDSCPFVPSRWNAHSESSAMVGPVLVRYGSELQSVVTPMYPEAAPTATSTREGPLKESDDRYDYFGELVDEGDDAASFNKTNMKAALMALAPIGIDEEVDTLGKLSPTSPFAAVDVGSIQLASPHSVYALKSYRKKSMVPMREALEQPVPRPQPVAVDVPAVDARLFPSPGVCDLRSCRTHREVTHAMKTLVTTPVEQLPGKQRVTRLVLSGVNIGSVGDAVASRLHVRTSVDWFGDENMIEQEELFYRSEALKLVFPILSTRSSAHLIQAFEADGCELHDVDAAALAFLLRHKPTEERPRVQLASISLKGNSLTDWGVDLLKKAVKYNENVHQIDVSGNPRVKNVNNVVGVLQERLLNNQRGISNLTAMQRLFGGD